jgi:hypothetical protein
LSNAVKGQREVTLGVLTLRTTGQPWSGGSAWKRREGKRSDYVAFDLRISTKRERAREVRKDRRRSGGQLITQLLSPLCTH